MKDAQSRADKCSTGPTERRPQRTVAAAHRDIAAAQLDALVFLGDYIYEGRAHAVGQDGAIRSHNGAEPTDLPGYRDSRPVRTGNAASGQHQHGIYGDIFETAARFVSGYIYSPSLDGSGHVGGGSTHAWCQVYLPGAGWVEFDPTNGIIGNRDLIRIAVARDPRQAVPLSGTWMGEPSDFEGMTVEVNVTSSEGKGPQRAVDSSSPNSKPWLADPQGAR